MVRLAFLIAVMSVLVGCADYAGEASELRDACNAGTDKTACIDYQTLTAACLSPISIITTIGCEGVGPASPLHPSGILTSAQPGGAYNPMVSRSYAPALASITPAPGVPISVTQAMPVALPKCTEQEQPQVQALTRQAREQGFQYHSPCN